MSDNEPDIGRASAFMMLEFESLQNRTISLEQIKSNRVNFLLIVVAALAAGSTQIEWADLASTYQRVVIVTAAGGILLLGLLTLQQNIVDSAAIVLLFRRAGRIRLWFVEQYPQLVQHVPFQYGDDRPRMYTTFLAFRGGEAVLLTINTVAFVALCVSAVFPSTWSYVFGVILASALTGWFAQILYIRLMLARAEMTARGSIRFPYAKMYEKFN